jgi:hypothetical protein
VEPRHCLLLKAAVDDSDDARLLGSLTELRQILTLPFAEFAVYRGLQTPDLYAYGVLEGAAYPADRDLQRVDAMARQLPVFAASAPAIDRLESVFTATGASAGASAGFRYIVETDAADGWEGDIFRWYDVEHMPALAAVPGCVHAQRFLNRDGRPRSHACYDLTDPNILQTAAWLAVRRTAWSDRVRPQFRNTRRTMFRSLHVSSNQRGGPRRRR